MDTFERIRELLAEQLDIDEEKITMDSNILEDFDGRQPGRGRYGHEPGG